MRLWNSYDNYDDSSWWYSPRRRHPVLSTIGVIAVLLILGIRYFFFESVQRLECLPNDGCTLYIKDNPVSPEQVDRKFNPKDIQNYEYIRHSRRSGTKSNRHYYYTYTLLINMKDGTRVHLKDFEKRDKQDLVNLINDMWYGKEIHLP